MSNIPLIYEFLMTHTFTPHPIIESNIEFNSHSSIKPNHNFDIIHQLEDVTFATQNLKLLNK